MRAIERMDETIVERFTGIKDWGSAGSLLQNDKETPFDILVRSAQVHYLLSPVES
jgi:hypothetical protein